jgi:probable HAF family extracellular repeat protein
MNWRLNMKRQHTFNKTIFAHILAVALLATIAMPLSGLAQGTATPNQAAAAPHYKLIDMGTLGGPNSFSAWLWSKNINSQGTAIAEADTSIVDPFAPNCLQDCLVNLGLQWKNGVLTNMGALPGGNNSSFPSWINDLGDSVGFSNNNLIDPLTGYPEFRATLWKGGKVFDLGTLGGNMSFANAINNRGQVVGGALNSILDNDSNFGWSPFQVATQFRAFLWQNGMMSDLGTLGTGNNAVALFVNDRGQVAGQSLTDSSANSPTGFVTIDPFFWQNGKMVDIGTLGGTFGVPYAMNSVGHVVGISNVAGDQTFHGFFWDEENGLKDLGTVPGGSLSYALWINDAGEIVGMGDFFNGGHGILWKNGKTIDLGTLPGDCSSEALVINSQGQIIGNSSPDCASDGVAVLWENGGAPFNLNTLVAPGSSVNVTFPVSINDRGEIVAHGVLPNGDTHAVLLIPCDENHADVEGCDFNSVEAGTAAPVRPAQNTKAPVAKQAYLSPAEMMTQFRAMTANRNRRFGAVPLK